MRTYYKLKNNISDIFFIFLGAFIASLGINLFLVHAQLLSGGVTGIALIIEYTFKIPAGISILIINIPLILLSYKKLDKCFTIYTTIGMLCLSASLIVTKPLSYFINMESDLLIFCIYGGVLCGIGYGLVFLRHGSTGGIDIITILIRKKYSNYNIGSLGFSINLIIVIIGALISGLPQALYTIISLFIQSSVLDRVLKGLNSRKLFLILTSKEKDIIEYVIKKLNRGITSLFAEGEYTHSKKKMLYCIVNSHQMIDLKTAVHNIDCDAFITIIDISEVRGKGFLNI